MVPDRLLASITEKKKRLEAIRLLSGEALARLEHYYDIELTFTSNAIEGNTLSPVETTLVIENGVTIGGKPLRDHLEALDHFDAIGYVRVLARASEPVTESDVRNLHRLRRSARGRISPAATLTSRDTSVRRTAGTSFRRRRRFLL